jgi:hypothetical protein
MCIYVTKKIGLKLGIKNIVFKSPLEQINLKLGCINYLKKKGNQMTNEGHSVAEINECYFI